MDAEGDRPEPLESAAAAPAPGVKALSCPSCGGTVTLRAAGYTVTVACEYCSSLLDVANPDVRLIAEYHEMAARLQIPLGTRGTIEGVEWEAIGYVERSEDGAYPWSEYLLFNPYRGYRWLITDGRGWSFGEMLTRTPEEWSGGVSLGHDTYVRFFGDGEARVDYVAGEFYWRVRAGERVNTDDYVRPGFMLSRERNAQEVSWTLSRLLDPREMKAAFGIDPPSDPWPPLPHQVSPYGAELGRVAKLGFAAAFLILLLLIFVGSGSTLLRGTIPYALDGASRSATLGPITVTKPYQLVSIRAHAPSLDNSWIDIDYALVDRKTQTSFEAYGAAERYSGRDSDGAWTEGNRASSVKLAAIPPGTYDLVVDYKATRWAGKYPFDPDYQPPDTTQDLNISVRSGAFFGSNAFLAMLLILLPLVYFLARHVKFEQARQDESDFGRTGAAKLFTSDDDEGDDE
jgi:hypothetical protein